MKKILNILLALMMAATVGLSIYAVVTDGAESAISLTLVWGYTLVGLALASALVCAFAGMITSADGLKGAIISLVLGVAVIGVSYYIAAGHTIQIVNLGDGGFFPAEDTIITEASVLVTYVVCAVAVVVAIVSEVWGALK